MGVKLFSDSLPLLQAKAEAVRRVVEQVRGAEDVSVGVSAGALQLEVDIDRPAIARYGLSVDDVRGAVEMGVGGRPVSESSMGGAGTRSSCAWTPRTGRRPTRWARSYCARRAAAP